MYDESIHNNQAKENYEKEKRKNIICCDKYVCLLRVLTRNPSSGN